MSPRVMAFANHKGGVGKTATTTGLAAAIAAKGGRALLIDMDPQGNATTGVGVVCDDSKPNVAHILGQLNRGGAGECITPTSWDGVDIIPAGLDLSHIAKSGDEDIPWRLKLALEGADLSQYTAVLIDCPPSVGRLLFAALMAADGVVGVIKPEVDSVKGFRDVETILEKVQAITGGPELQKIIISDKDSRWSSHDFHEGELRRYYGDLVARTIVPHLTARADAHESQQSPYAWTRGKAVSLRVAYDGLLDELGLKVDGRKNNGAQISTP
ncbi:AAA family ATPase [Hoyosella sp. YIM 151337]|uniref:ParA family protein n=1 Tax=Hoyosella sp. YIM 151337 TaxID=2992742 RepID=UPI0022367D50|nr:AAA family ATPase [Hoyosella sp. YIM 151337]MCW4356134.1 AAA family ATPase [Hoyosella sp. YIM 151337]